MLWCTSFKIIKCFTIFYILNKFLHVYQKKFQIELHFHRNVAGVNLLG
jgi:hypothetical protein